MLTTKPPKNPPQPDPNRLHAPSHNNEAGPIHDAQSSEYKTGANEYALNKNHRRPDGQRHHSPRLGHDTAEFALHAHSLAEHADIRRQQRHDRGPVTALNGAQSAMSDTNKD